MRIVARIRDDDLRRKLEQVAAELETEVLFPDAALSGPAGLLPNDVFVVELDESQDPEQLRTYARRAGAGWYSPASRKRPATRERSYTRMSG